MQSFIPAQWDESNEEYNALGAGSGKCTFGNEVRLSEDLKVRRTYLRLSMQRLIEWELVAEEMAG